MSNKRKLSKCFMINMIILIFINFILTSRVLAQWPYSGTYSEPSIENQLYAAYGVSPEGVFIWPWGGRQYPISPYPTTSWIGNQSYNPYFVSSPFSNYPGYGFNLNLYRNNIPGTIWTSPTSGYNPFLNTGFSA